MRTQIKICGITSLAEVEFVNRSDIDYVGLVFAKSKRRVSVQQAVQLSEALRVDIKKCGVFVEHTVEEINDISAIAKLNIAQVHKDYSAEDVRRIDIPVWYAVNIRDERSIAHANRVSRWVNVEGVIADSYVKGQSGGTGKTFNWELLSGIDKGVFLILAGGLNESNIEKAINAVHPHVVDISSGAEATYGGITQKNEEKVRELVRKVKAHG